MVDVRRVRPEVEGFTAYSPGLSIEEIKSRYGLKQVVKMASNENPLGVSPVVQKAVAARAASLFRYPRVDTPELTRAVAEELGVDPKRVVCGNGSDDIIDMVVRIKPRPGVDHVLTFDPCYSMYEIQARLCGVEHRSVPLNPDFSFPLEALAEAADERTALVVLVTPDNPSGFAATADQIEELAGRLPPQALLVVDEAYVDFAEPVEEYSVVPRLSRLDNVCVMRTFAKAYGLAGVRLGYGVMPEWLAEHVLATRLPFSVNVLAEAAGIAALRDTVFRDETLRVVRQGREHLGTVLEALGCRVWPSQANFIMFEPPRDAGEVFEELLSRGIIVRWLKSYGLKKLIRVSIGSERENSLFAEAMGEVLAHG